ncbi:hypothetical protein SAMN05421737_101150 [Shouchella lonarensis]|uniref:Uncharacterized protein n=1 Tax=Shouchella lonarensis TaxID=1464122 RepID=A0A1G6GJY4_9BACI|nr:hypothetical protein SAMN05421737_101150 [Shouchella lonarensis]
MVFLSSPMTIIYITELQQAIQKLLLLTFHGSIVMTSAASVIQFVMRQVYDDIGSRLFKRSGQLFLFFKRHIIHSNLIPKLIVAQAVISVNLNALKAVIGFNMDMGFPIIQKDNVVVIE